MVSTVHTCRPCLTMVVVLLIALTTNKDVYQYPEKSVSNVATSTLQVPLEANNAHTTMMCRRFKANALHV